MRPTTILYLTPTKPSRKQQCNANTDGSRLLCCIRETDHCQL